MTENPTYNTDLLVRELASDDLAARFDAASLIGIGQVDAAADALVARLGVETDCQVRERVTWATVRVIDAALPAVLEALTSSTPRVRMQAAHVLSKAARPEFAEHLAPVVADPDADVAIKGYRAAANTGHPDVVPMLVARLGDGDGHQKDALTNAFVSLGTASVADLVAALASEEADVREHAAEALGHLGPDAAPAAGALAGLASDDPEPEVRLVALTALGQLGPEADEALERLSGSGDARTAAVARALVDRRPAQAGTSA